MDRKSRLLLSDIVYWGERRAAYVEGLTEADFAVNGIASNAVCWCLLCIGEAAGALHRINPALISADPSLELMKANGMRNRLAHDYGGIDLGVVWVAATVSVPEMVAAARRQIDAG